jgi:hypothetical protein
MRLSLPLECSVAFCACRARIPEFNLFHPVCATLHGVDAVEVVWSVELVPPTRPHTHGPCTAVPPALITPLPPTRAAV